MRASGSSQTVGTHRRLGRKCPPSTLMRHCGAHRQARSTSSRLLCLPALWAIGRILVAVRFQYRENCRNRLAYVIVLTCGETGGGIRMRVHGRALLLPLSILTVTSLCSPVLADTDVPCYKINFHFSAYAGAVLANLRAAVSYNSATIHAYTVKADTH